MDQTGYPWSGPQSPTLESAITSFHIGDIANAKLRSLYAYWRKGGEEERALRRDQLDLQRIAPLLSRILLAEVVDDGHDLVIRIAGDEIESRFGGSMRGLRLNALFKGLPPSATTRQWFDIIADHRPRYRRGPIPYAHDRYFYSERLLLPLFDTKEAVSHVLCAAFHSSAPTGDSFAPVIDAVVVD